MLTSKLAAIGTLINEGLGDIRQSYGEGSPGYLEYHNDLHALDKMRNDAAIARYAIRAGKMTLDQAILMRLPSVWHDYFPHGDRAEERTASALTSRMDEFNVFENDEIDWCSRLVLATICEFKDGKFVQNATDEYATKLFVDGDVAILGGPFETMWDRGKRVMAEEQGHPILPEECATFIQRQIAFMEAHEWQSPEAPRAFPHKEDNMRRLEVMLDKTQ